MKALFVEHKKIVLISLVGLLLLGYSMIPTSSPPNGTKPLRGFFVAERTEAIYTMRAGQKVAHEVEETLEVSRQTMRLLTKETQKNIEELKQMVEKYSAYPLKLIQAWTYVAYAMALMCVVIAIYYGVHAYTLIPRA